MDTITLNPMTKVVPADSAQLNVVISPSARLTATTIASQKSLFSFTESEVINYSSGIQSSISQQLDVILANITKGNSPVLFQLFQKLKRGMDDAKVEEVEEAIRKSLEKGVLNSFLDRVGLSSVSKRLQSSNEVINNLITKKSVSLKDLVAEMEKQVKEEATKLIEFTGNMKKAGQVFRDSIENAGVLAVAGRLLLEEAKTEYDNKIALTKDNNDPLLAETIQRMKQTMDLFEGQVIIMEILYVKSPQELEYIRLGEGAALTTLAETANTVLSEFIDIKSSLIKLAVMNQLQSLQTLNQERRNLRNQLKNHSYNLLEKLSIDAEKAKGINRLEDAENLLTISKRIDGLHDKLKTETQNNQTRFAEARTKLETVRKSLLINN